MTSKEIFDNLKKERLDRRRKIKMLNFMKADINMKLKFGHPDEDTLVSLLSELKAIEINTFKLQRNRYNSKFYTFTESSLYNRKGRKNNEK